MCDHPNREAAMVVISEGVPDETGKKRGGVWCDPCLEPLVRALNDGGIRTVASCCGHGRRPGKIMLDDGRELFIAPNFDAARQVDAAFPASRGTGDPVSPTWTMHGERLARHEEAQ